MKEIVLTQESTAIIAAAVNRYAMMVDFVRKVLIEDKDFGKVPGSAKPTLLKPGAEKLNNLFELYPDFQVIDKLVDWQNGIFFYQYQCFLRHRKTGELWGSGLGSCNSRESKYRYRYIETEAKPSKQEAELAKVKGLGKWRKKGNDWVWTERIDNDQIFDLVNTIDKMAQKRALIAATLIACNASEFFTQDIEDLDIVDGEYHETVSVPSEAQPQTINGNGKPPSIYDALVEAGLFENAHAAKNAMNKCKTGYDTPEKALAWARLYRGWRDSGAESDKAAEKANLGEAPK